MYIQQIKFTASAGKRLLKGEKVWHAAITKSGSLGSCSLSAATNESNCKSRINVFLSAVGLIIASRTPFQGVCTPAQATAGRGGGTYSLRENSISQEFPVRTLATESMSLALRCALPLSSKFCLLDKLRTSIVPRIVHTVLEEELDRHNSPAVGHLNSTVSSK